MNYPFFTPSAAIERANKQLSDNTPLHGSATPRVATAEPEHDWGMRGVTPAATEHTSRLLWESCRRDPDPEAIRRALADGADASLAMAAASQHRIGALLWRALGVAGARSALGDDAAALGAVADALRMEAVLLFPRAVARAVEPLTEVGLQPVIFKGPAVATRYPEPGLRPMEDIDILLPAADHRRAVELLHGDGWRVARAGGAGHYDTVLVHEQVPSLSLELHYGLEHNAERVTTLKPAALWARRVPLECLGTRAYGLAPADELVVLAAHAGKPFHGFMRLLWIADLAMIVGHADAHGEPVDWKEVRAVAQQARCLTVVGAALALARQVGVQAPAELFPLPSHGFRGQALRQLLSVTWPLTAPELHRYQLNYALTDAPTRRMRSLVTLVGNWHGLRVRARARAGSLLHPVAGARREVVEHPLP
jgi:Uncharacterised nucleotidyltransferase